MSPTWQAGCCKCLMSLRRCASVILWRGSVFRRLTTPPMPLCLSTAVSVVLQFGVRSSRWLTHTDPFNGPISGTTQVSRYQKGKNNLDFTGARDSEWQWHQLGHMQVCTSLQTDNHASPSLLKFLQARCPSCRPTNSLKALKAKY